MQTNQNEINRTEMLMNYIERLNNGEAWESVQNDFRETFGSVDAKEIVDAEKTMMQNGVPLSQVQKLCDLHSALFHGNTRQERIAQAEASVAASIKTKRKMQDMPSAKSAEIQGHPLQILTMENEEFTKRLNQMRKLLTQNAETKQILNSLNDLKAAAVHYDKKDELILPPLKRHGVAGPADVMWNVDGELRQSVNALIRQLKQTDEPELPQNVKDDIRRLCARMQEMIFKEEKILYPLAEKYFTEEEWQMIDQDLPRFGYAWIKEIPQWQDAKPEKKQISIEGADGSVEQAEIQLPGGTLSLAELEGILRTLPVELTFIDANDTNRYFSEDSSLFPRAVSALGHQVYECHPPKVIPIVQNVIQKLKSGEENAISFVTTKKGRKTLVRYLAVRSKQKEYLGVLEVVEDITDIA